MTPYGPVRLAIAPELKARGTLTVVQSMTIANCSVDEARNTLTRMVAAGKARAEKLPNGTTRYHHVDNVEKTKKVKRDGSTPSCETHRTYPLHHRRDDLVAALFGAPQHPQQ